MFLKCLISRVILSFAAVNYGYQAVGKSPAARALIEVISWRRMTGKEIRAARGYTEDMRAKGETVIDEVAKRYARRGRFLFEIMEADKACPDMEELSR